MDNIYVILHVYSRVTAKKCSHVLAVAESNGELMKFLQWYTSCEPSPKHYSVEHERSSNWLCWTERRTSQTKKVEKPEQLVTITKSDVSSECGPSGFNMGASTSQVNYNVMFPSTPRSPPASYLCSTDTTTNNHHLQM